MLNQYKRFNISLYFYKTMEQVPHLFMDYPKQLKCSLGNESFSICCSKSCTEYPFQCRVQKCECWSQIHKDCITIRWQSIATKILSKKKQVDDNFTKFTQEIQKIYQDVIEKFTKQRQQFRQWAKYFGLNKNQRRFANLIAQNSVDKLTGQLISQIIPNLEDTQEFIRPDPQAITQYWNKSKKKVNSLTHHIRDVYLYPAGFFPLALKQHEQRILKLFTNKPSRFKMIYQGSKNNFSMRQFHKKCDGVQDTFSIVELADGKIAGGFTSVKWQSCKPKWVNDPKSKTFKFTQQQNSSQLKKANASTNAVYHYDQWGPSFGAGRDLIIFSQQTFTMTSFTVPSSYEGRSYDLFCPVGSKINQAKKFVEFWVFSVLWFD